MTHCLVCNQEIEVSREAIDRHAQWHVEMRLIMWFAKWMAATGQKI